MRTSHSIPPLQSTSSAAEEIPQKRTMTTTTHTASQPAPRIAGKSQGSTRLTLLAISSTTNLQCITIMGNKCSSVDESVGRLVFALLVGTADNVKEMLNKCHEMRPLGLGGMQAVPLLMQAGELCQSPHDVDLVQAIRNAGPPKLRSESRWSTR